ncbi:hypothetical protein E4695_13350 [Alcaligenaceae bacterium 429]|uniref:hypothetical protein n=1 Tax=Paenalcaligenes sp. Me52 TaxID=3392038 RepID=UPI0010927E30|nr:hypothetical protein E4695_13350 [Alcaligenaceae bacterium 429]
MTQIQALENLSQPELVKLVQTERQQHADDMDMLSKELAERPHAKIDRPMAIGCGRFGVGIKASTVLDAAARHYDFVTNEKREQDRIELGKLKADNFLQYGAPTDLEAYKAWLEKVSSPTPAAPTVPAETLRVCGVIANKIEEGALSHVGFYSNTALSEFIRQLMRAVAAMSPIAPVAPQIPRAPYSVEARVFSLATDAEASIYIASVPLSACTCPGSGDGSLRWPCPVHPPEDGVI